MRHMVSVTLRGAGYEVVKRPTVKRRWNTPVAIQWIWSWRRQYAAHEWHHPGGSSANTSYYR